MSWPLLNPLRLRVPGLRVLPLIKTIILRSKDILQDPHSSKPQCHKRQIKTDNTFEIKGQ